MSVEDHSLQNFHQTRTICAMLYFDYMEKKSVFDHLNTPTTPERLLYELGWSDRAILPVSMILNFLSQFQITTIAGETVSKGYNVSFFEAEENRISLDQIRANPVHHFIVYGLKLLDDLIEGGGGVWDFSKHTYTYESALLYPTFTYLQGVLNDRIRELSNRENLPRILFIGEFVEWFIPPIITTVEDPEQVTLYTHDEKSVSRAISYLELDNRTSKYSSSVQLLTDKLPEKEFDLIFCYNLFGFERPLQEWCTIISKLVKDSGQVVCQHLSKNIAETGLEPMLQLNEKSSKPIALNVISKYFKIAGFKEPKVDEHLGSLLVAEKIAQSY